MTVVDWLLDQRGWAFNPDKQGCEADPVFGAAFLREVMTKPFFDPIYGLDFAGRNRLET